MTISNIRQVEALKKAAVLAEALPWLLKFQDSIVVIKFGGNAMTSSELSKQFAQDVVFLKLAGLKPVVVHGGGPQITQALKLAGLESEFISGFRVTTKEAVKVVRDVLINEIQKNLVQEINSISRLAVGMSGDEKELIQTQKMEITKDGKSIDLGFVGTVKSIDVKQILNVIEDGQIPVISTIGVGQDGDIYNVNADIAASAIAKAIKANKFVVLTDVSGLMENYPDEKTLIPTIDIANLKILIPKLDEGMRPKMMACLEAVESGVSRAHVIDGRLPHAVLVEVFTNAGTGTMVIESMDKE